MHDRRQYADEDDGTEISGRWQDAGQLSVEEELYDVQRWVH